MKTPSPLPASVDEGGASVASAVPGPAPHPAALGSRLSGPGGAARHRGRDRGGVLLGARGCAVQVTRRPQGTSEAAIDPTGEWVWWFDDNAGNERAVWRQQPFGSGPGEQVESPTGLPTGFSAGLALGRRVAVVGHADSAGIPLFALTPWDPARLMYEHVEDKSAGPLSEDGTIVAVVHSEHGDARWPALRVLRLADGSTAGELWDGLGKGLRPLGFRPVAGNQRLLVKDERHVRPRPSAGATSPSSTSAAPATSATRTGPATRSPCWWPSTTSPDPAPPGGARPGPRGRRGGAGRAGRRHSADRDQPCRQGRLDPLVLRGPAAVRTGRRRRAGARPAGRPAAAEPARPSRTCGSTAPAAAYTACCAARPGRTASPGRPVSARSGGAWRSGGAGRRCLPAWLSAWVHYGFAVAQVNYGAPPAPVRPGWRDSPETRGGHVELEDVVAVGDHLVAVGVAAPTGWCSAALDGVVSSPCSAWAHNPALPPPEDQAVRRRARPARQPHELLTYDAATGRWWTTSGSGRCG